MTVIAPCHACGHDPEHDDRFCAHCGLGLEAHAATTGESVAVATTVAPARADPVAPGRPGRRSAWRRLATVAALAVVGVLAWQIFQPPRQHLDDVAATLGAVEARVPAGWADRPGDEPFISIEPEDVAADPVADPAGRPVAPEVSGSDLPEIGLDAVSDLAADWVIVSNSTHLVRLDPVTGAVDAYEPGGLVIGHDEDHLVLVSGRGVILSAAASDPESVRTLFNTETGHLANVRVVDGAVVASLWMPSEADSGDDSFRSVTIDLDSGAVEEGRNATGWLSGWNGVGFQPGYGSYDVAPDGRERWLSDGFVEVAGERQVLILNCAAPDDCERFWLERASGARVDRHVPADTDNGFGPVRVFGPDDRFVSVVGESLQRYFDTTTGDYLAGPDSLAVTTSLDVAVEAVSADGRYLMTPTRSGVIVHDLATGSSGVLAVDIPGYPLSVKIVPKSEAGP